MAPMQALCQRFCFLALESSGVDSHIVADICRCDSTPFWLSDVAVPRRTGKAVKAGKALGSQAANMERLLDKADRTLLLKTFKPDRALLRGVDA